MNNTQRSNRGFFRNEKARPKKSAASGVLGACRGGWALSALAIFLMCAVPLRSVAQDNGEGAKDAEAAGAPQPEPPRELQITADSVDMQMNAGKARFEGDVVVLDRGLRIESQTMEVILNEAGAMTEAVFDGAVSITQEQQDRAANAEHAVYNMARGELVLTGKPELREGERTLRNAQKIIYNRVTGRIRTEGTRDGGRPTLIIPLAADNENAEENADDNKNTTTDNGERK